MAGRDVSVTQMAFGTTRLQRTGGMMGEIVGMAASLCKKYDCQPRDVYFDHLDDLKDLMRGYPSLDRAGDNLALKAKADASSYSYIGGENIPAKVNDGIYYNHEGDSWDQKYNSSLWISRSDKTHWISLTWPSKHTINCIRILSGYFKELERRGNVCPLEDFEVQYKDKDGNWVTAKAVTGNGKYDWVGIFEPVSTNNIRIYITKVGFGAEEGDFSAKVREIEVYFRQNE